MNSIPIEILFGVYLGVLTGIIPALVAGILGFTFKYFTDVTIPGFGVVVLALAIAGINGGLLALNDETIRSSDRAISLLTAIIVVLMLSLYAHAQGDKLGSSVPRRITIQEFKDKTLSTDVIKLVEGRKQATISVVGEVEDIEGYPPVPVELRSRITNETWTFPADLPIAELETRFADRLRSEFDLADVQVSLDAKANATVAAAPPLGGLSKRVPPGKRAVSVPALVPTGLVRGETVRIVTPELSVTGTLVSARSGQPSAPNEPSVATDGGTEADETAVPPATASTTGGEGRVTVAVPRSEATQLLSVSHGQVIVLPRGTRREYELAALLRRGGKRFRRLVVRADSPIAGRTIAEAGIRIEYGVVVLAVKPSDGRWHVAPVGSTTIAGGDELYVVGAAKEIDTFSGVVA